MYSLEEKVIGNITTLVIILFEDLSNRYNSTDRVEKVDRVCLWAKAKSIKQ